MRHYAIKLEKNGISENRYRELEFFCLQYDEKKRQLQALLHQSPPPPDGMPRARNLSDPTAQTAIRIEGLSQDCEDIEQSIEAAVGKNEDPVMRRWLRLYVTRRDKPLISDIPCGRRQFYDMRKRFFCVLNEKRSPRGKNIAL